MQQRQKITPIPAEKRPHITRSDYANLKADLIEAKRNERAWKIALLLTTVLAFAESIVLIWLLMQQ